MAKYTIGTFRCFAREKKTKRIFNYNYILFARRGYYPYDDFIEVGNNTFNLFFRFNMHRPEETRWLYRKKAAERFVGLKPDELKTMLRPVMEHHGLNNLLLNKGVKSRKEILDMIVKDEVVKRLTGK